MEVADEIGGGVIPVKRMYADLSLENHALKELI
jgi:hypothetical protein